MSEMRTSYGVPLSVAIQTDVGRVRSNNEDSNGHAWLRDGSLFVMVADGMGGHEAGEVASSLAVQVVEDVVGRDPVADPRERLYNALLEANESILDEGRRGGKGGMGTTSVCAIIRGREVHVALVGDSRLYQFRRGHLVWRTVDHTRVQMLIDHGEITEEEARVHPEAGMLTRALGHQRMADGRPLVPDVIGEPLAIEDGDGLVLSSDGLHDLIEDWEIGRLVAGKDGDEAAQALVELACERGGHDNVTVAVVIVGDRFTEYDPNYVPPAREKAEATFAGHEPEEPAPRPAAMPSAPPPTGVFSAADVDDVPAPPKSRMGLIIGVIVVLVLLGGGGLALLAVLFGAWYTM